MAQSEIDALAEEVVRIVGEGCQTPQAPAKIINIWGEESFRRFMVKTIMVLKERVDKIMADLDDVKQALADTKASLVTVGDSIGNIAADETALLKKITDLETALGGGTVVSAADMASLKSDTANLRDQLAAAATSLKGIADAVPDVP